MNSGVLPKRIVVIDDHVLLREGLERVLNATGDFVVCEQAGTGAEAKEVVREMRPDAVIVDVCLPDIDGIDLTRELLAEFPDLIVLVLSMHEEPEYAVRAMHAGARGYLLKNEAIENLHTGLRDAFNGRKIFTSSILEGTV